ncbi:thiaminase II [Fictibacillus sp. KIGAM418]|uniref:Aminopyrimidine aminohydrolase n=1 Tax=Fictibacillus marinisediminis TaxID=2878389 RepID=A0A9X1X8Q5_9BACL|nr:thiaminase II [Fictibacillus marinisediminis]MCK6256024.1 thiaminase II [Fictibacillus marinisediminis]
MTKSKEERFTDRLHRNVEPIWMHTHLHPFVQGIKDGSLPKERFGYYMKQDYVFLKDYAKLFALGTIKSKDTETMSWFSSLLHETLNTEMDLHREYCHEIGIEPEELEAEQASPINLAYTRYMLNASQQGTLAELISCMLPCMWSYHEIGTLLKREAGSLAEHPYTRWIEMYASEEFGALAQWLINELNKLAKDKTEQELAVLEEHFLTTSRFEFMFWDMVYYGHGWPV